MTTRPLIDRTAPLPWAPPATTGPITLDITGPGSYTLTPGADYILNFRNARIVNHGADIGSGAAPGGRSGVCEFHGAARTATVVGADTFTPPQIASVLTAPFDCTTDTVARVTSVRDIYGALIVTPDAVNAPILLRIGGNLIAATGATETPTPRFTGCTDTGAYFNASAGLYTRHGVIPTGAGVYLGEAYRTPFAFYDITTALHLEGIKTRGTINDSVHLGVAPTCIATVQNCDMGRNWFSGETSWGLAGHPDNIQTATPLTELAVARSTLRSGPGGRGILANNVATLRMYDVEHWRNSTTQNNGFVTQFAGAPLTADFRNAWSITPTGGPDTAPGALPPALYATATPNAIAQTFAPLDAGLTYTSPGYLP